MIDLKPDGSCRLALEHFDFSTAPGWPRLTRPTLGEQDGTSEHLLSAPPRGAIPAVTHVDGTARLQTADARHDRYERLLRAFWAATDCPVLLNTFLTRRRRCARRLTARAAALRDVLSSAL